MEKIIKNPTLFVDIDGTLVKYRKFTELLESTPQPIQDVVDFVNNHYNNGSVIMITTARPSEYEEFTKEELENIGVKYHQLIMNCGRGTRIILNDKDPKNPIDRAVGINLIRDLGLNEIIIPENINPYESN